MRISAAVLVLMGCAGVLADDRDGGSSATGGGSAATGGGSAATGGGSAATGGGSSATGGGSAATGGGSAATGGGSAATGGGSSATGGGHSTGDGGFDPYFIDFATATIENPLSAGGVWSNNTQGVGGNLPPTNLTSMQVGLASDGHTVIAFDTHGGISYDDSFAFVPGFTTGDAYVEAQIYIEAGYNPNAHDSNHELELLMGASSGDGTRIWNEFLMNAGGGVDILYLNGGPSDFQSISNVGGTATGVPHDGDIVRATRVGNVLSLYRNGELWIRYDGSDPSKVARGTGLGIAAFIRPGATHNKYGFRRVQMGSLK